MYSYQKITVTPSIPDNLKRLKELAYNLWWIWHPEARQLFCLIDEETWKICKGNPVTFLQNVPQESLNRASQDSSFMNTYHQVLGSYDDSLQNTQEWFPSTYPNYQGDRIVYFSAEYGFHEVLPIYSGGLGVLSGDHCKTASDMGIPFTAVGLLYQEGYFNQSINRDGWPESSAQVLNFDHMPILPAHDSQGNDIVIDVDFPGRKVYARIWEVHVGRVHLYLLDTQIKENDDHDKKILKNLYGGDQETRICQEILLGIGGYKALQALGITPSIIHMNEGHCSFAALALMRDYMKEKGCTFHEALEAVALSTAFTTHTPVPAGTDTFPLHLMDKYFSSFYNELKINRKDFLDLGLSRNWEGHDVFNMTVLGLKMSGLKNGVSKIHGMVSRNIYQELWREVPEEEVPITHITNGIHLPTWLAPEIYDAIRQMWGDHWNSHIQPQELREKIHELPDEVLWNIHLQLKKRMVFFARERVLAQKARQGRSFEDLRFIKDSFNPNALIIGFARRFATYKRATLIFRDRQRLSRILNNPDRPVQLIFSGKAHPADYPGQELIKQIQDLSESPEFKGKIFFIENYSMEVARYLTQGADVWLNNPKKPLEASGTSGQKAGLNGCLNFSILDGWWAEGYNGENGWAIGDDRYSENPDNQDSVDAENLYTVLEEQIVPCYFDRDPNQIPHSWVQKMKTSLETIILDFTTRRMLREYTDNIYIPLLDQVHQIREKQFTPAKELAEIKSKLLQHWQEIRIIPVDGNPPPSLIAGQPLKLQCRIQRSSIPTEWLQPEVYFGKVGLDGMLEETETLSMEAKNGDVYESTLSLKEGGQYGYTFRLLPHNPHFMNPLDTGLIKWADFHH